MFFKLLAAFILVPLMELYLLLQLAEVTSVGLTFLIVLVTGILGSILARREGVNAWRRFRLAMAEGRMPGTEIQDGMMIAFAAALLLTPGLLTDALGFTLLIPAGRTMVRHFIARRYRGSVQFQVFQSGGGPSGPGPFGQAPHRQPRRHDDCDTIDATSVERRA
ncbi:FxsA family protein [Crateriforma conspicua]|uniref:Phage T7 F exclusion suppressor FxsA n=1 Tax=Crateriforma conspicua TaxID=2527996 RepID=A0A5C6G144_9PLAN|nr:FxsA family protein [Crateriforma conspicua]TWU67358.1 phage T7 F exclusion suppressor FxsA [Crateriforma conspicua]